ncbi:hypothetical protein [Arthrobacter sp. 49Tsu3.1M3]|uniref:hypothetical protein n=1 Tax=Arthrobacter sp. 49Tsu3.1M3 TaxID=1279029 RepID=UPI0011789AC7|nr:hypothetical protein [Arthrobacter sp. 49Tsu3.1M3]
MRQRLVCPRPPGILDQSPGFFFRGGRAGEGVGAQQHTELVFDLADGLQHVRDALVVSTAHDPRDLAAIQVNDRGNPRLMPDLRPGSLVAEIPQ